MSIIILDYVVYAYKNYYSQIFLEECKYKQQQQQQQQQLQQQQQQKNYIDEELKSESDNDE